MKSYRESGLAANDRGIAPVPAPLAEPDKSPGTLIEQSVPCLACGYDLMGMRTDARCPECGFDIGESVRPEVRGFGGLITLRRFYFGVWTIALAPIVVLLGGVLRIPDGPRDSFIQLIIGPTPASHRGWSAQAVYWQRFEFIQQYADLATHTISTAVLTIATLLLASCPRHSRQLVRSALAPPRLISIRTAIIAYGSVLCMGLVPLAIVWELSSTNADLVISTTGLVLSTGIWVSASAFAWWIVSRVITGRLRLAFLSATAMLTLGLLLAIARHARLMDMDDLSRALTYSGLGFAALASALLWRWIAKGFRMPRLAAAATIYAATAPIIITIGCATIWEVRAVNLVSVPTSLAIALLSAAALMGSVLGTTIAVKLRRIRQARKG